MHTSGDALAALVDLDAVGRMALSALVGGVGATGAFSVLLLGVVRAAEHREARRRLPLLAFVLVALLGLAGTVTSVYLAIHILIRR